MATESMETLVEVEIANDEEMEVRNNMALTLVGRFLADRPIRVHIMKERMAGVWRPGRGVNIREMGSGTFLFQFFHPLDLEKVLKQGPWSFDKHLLILSTIPEGLAPTEVPLYHIPFWIQVHNIPNGFMSESVGKHVGNTIGCFLEYDPKNSSDFWRLFMRVRVLLDVRKPLLKKLKLRKPGGDAKEVLLKYERLDIFCFLCGMLGHLDSSCDQRFELTSDDGSRNWGPEIKAEFRRGGSSGGARWLREEGQPWVAPNSGCSARENQGVVRPNLVEEESVLAVGVNSGKLATNMGGSSQGVNSGNLATNMGGGYQRVNEVDSLVEIFKNPSTLFKHTVASHEISPNRINENAMEADVSMEGDRKRMRECSEGGMVL